MCQRCELVAELEVLEAQLAGAEVAELERLTDVAAGIIPPWARRGLLPHERAARVNFAALDTSTGAAAQRITGTLEHHRSRIADELDRQLAAATTPAQVAAIAQRIADPARPITADVRGYDRLTADVAATVNADLEAAYHVGRESVRAEAAAQGIPTHMLPPPGTAIPADKAAELTRQAAASAAGPAAVVTQAVGAAAARLPLETADVASSRAALSSAARTDYAARLSTDYAVTPAQQATGGARVDTLEELPQAARYYASELLDGNTCGPCSMVDGVEYASLDEAEVDYPGGTYVGCDGGDRCRGTIVTVWDSEATPSVNDVAPVDRPEPPAPPAPPPPPPPPTTPPTAKVRKGKKLTAAEREEALAELAAANPEFTVDELRAANVRLEELRDAARSEAAATQDAARYWLGGGPSPLTGTTPSSTAPTSPRPSSAPAAMIRHGSSTPALPASFGPAPTRSGPPAEWKRPRPASPPAPPLTSSASSAPAISGTTTSLTRSPRCSSRCSATAASSPPTPPHGPTSAAPAPWTSPMASAANRHPSPLPLAP